MSKTFFPSFPCILSLGAEKAVSWNAAMLSQTICKQEWNNQKEAELKRSRSYEAHWQYIYINPAFDLTYSATGTLPSCICGADTG